MSSCLLFQSFVCIDQQDGFFCSRSTRDHILNKFTVAWSVDNFERLSHVSETDPRGVDRDVLGLFLEKSIEEEGILQRHPLFSRGFFCGFQLTFGQGTSISKKPPNQSGLPMIHMSHDHDTGSRFLGSSCCPSSTLSLRKEDRDIILWQRLGCWRHGDSLAHMNPFARSFCMALRS